MNLKTMALGAAALAAAGTLAQTAEAETKPEVVEEERSLLDDYVDLDLELTFYSAYVWRGQIMFDTAVWQPAGNLWLKLGRDADYGRIKLRGWANMAINGYKGPHRFGGMSIVDETVSYNCTAFDCLDFETGVIM